MSDRARPRVGNEKVTGAEYLQQEKAEKTERLAPFRTGEKLTQAERERTIAKQFPSTEKLDWNDALGDDYLFARIMRDILKLEQSTPGKSGPRSNNLDYEQGLASYRKLMGQDYATDPFAQAFSVLAADFSHSHLARKCHISKAKAQRLLSGRYAPTVDDMCKVADGFNKNPSYFLEYRKQFIMGVIEERLEKAPESTISYFRRVVEALDE